MEKKEYKKMWKEVHKYNKSPNSYSKKVFKCANCGNKYPESFCATKDITICRWCSEEEK